ncbi:MAG: hypothetical protein ACI8TP_004239 [Acidimicrobiales bacterium]|jgi:uncharacterized protein (TIGR02118 family)
MIKVTEIVNRRPGMSVEDFQAHWLHNHGPIVAKVPGLKRYVQSHVRLGGYKRGEVPFDGIAELWFDDKAALAAIVGTPEFAAAKADEPKFIDDTTLIELVVDEHIIKDNPVPVGAAGEPAVKSIEFLIFKPDMDPAEAQAYWLGTHGPIGAAIPTMTRYVQSHVRLGAYQKATRPPFDGMAVTWWKDLDAMRASASSREYQLTRDDEPNFIDGELPVILTSEHEIALPT